MVKDIYVLVGAAAHGKSTWAGSKTTEYFAKWMDERSKNPSQTGSYGYVNADMIRKQLYGDPTIQGDGNEVFGKVFEAYTGFLRNKAVDLIIVDNTSLKVRDRKRYYTLAQTICEAMGYAFNYHLVFFPPHFERALVWNKQRNRQVPEDVIARHCAVYQGPSEFERENCIIETVIHKER
jgi:predicted kinase